MPNLISNRKLNKIVSEVDKSFQKQDWGHAFDFSDDLLEKVAEQEQEQEQDSPEALNRPC